MHLKQPQKAPQMSSYERRVNCWPCAPYPLLRSMRTVPVFHAYTGVIGDGEVKSRCQLTVGTDSYQLFHLSSF